MLSILAIIDYQKEIRKIIASVNQLDELVSVITDDNIEIPYQKLLRVSEGMIVNPLDWHDTESPYLIPNIDFTHNNLLAIIFYSLKNYSKAFEYLSKDDPLYQHLLLATSIIWGKEINQAQYMSMLLSRHNQCIIHHYANYKHHLSFELLGEKYKEAIDKAEDDELKIFTAKHYVNLLIDVQQFAKAEALIYSLQDKAILEEAKNTLNTQLAGVMMQQLEIPFEVGKLKVIQDLFKEGMTFYKQRGLKINLALLLVDASEIAILQQDFITSKDYINKAIAYFREENLMEYLGEAVLQKAMLLYTWSKKGQPQYYKPAINTFQDALKIFKQDTHPQKFADIHHNMALIYSEIPASQKEKPIWAAFSVSSFKESLAFYTKENYPYENARINHNYATALIHFPQAKLYNNFDKAFELFEEVLLIRTSKKHPYERASTLINQLELYWLLNDRDRMADEIDKKIAEVKQLTDDPSMLERLAFHESKLKSIL